MTDWENLMFGTGVRRSVCIGVILIVVSVSSAAWAQDHGEGMLPRKVQVRLRGAGDDTLSFKGFFDDGGMSVDYTRPVTFSIGGFMRTLSLTRKSGGKSYVFKGGGTRVKIRPRRLGSSRGNFAMKVTGASLSGLIDPDDVTSLMMEVEGQLLVTAVVRLEDGKFRFGQNRGALIAPRLFTARGLIGTGRPWQDRVFLKCGLAGPAPSVLGDFHLTIEPDYDITIRGDLFQRRGDVFRYEHYSGSVLRITLDFERGRMKLWHRSTEVGPVDGATVDISIDPGTGELILQTRTLGEKGGEKAF
jgi:hypothetical protein